MLGSSRSLPGEAAELALPSDDKRSYKYARSHRILEYFGLTVAALLTIWTAHAAVDALPPGKAWLAALWCFGGLCLADFISGLVHWFADSYGTPQMPIMGGFVRTFREHHADQVDITRHDFVETNGDVCIFSSPVHFLLMLWVDSSFALFLMLGVFAGSYTNSQIHKWAHSVERPWLVRLCQRVRIFNSPAHHSRHHSGPHLTHYCITTGWMNPILDAIGFFRKAEWLLLKLGLQRTNLEEHPAS
jgi:ubiquitin-conjugating enzyme E2 variant